MNNREVNPKVLFLNRSNAISHPGGDTVLMNSLAEELRKQGISVTIDLNGTESIKDYSIVHLFNFTLSDWLTTNAKRAKEAGVPFVVTSLSEDIPRFHNQSHAVAETLVRYVLQKNQDRAWWRENASDWHKASPAKPVNNQWVVENAAAIFVCGSEEQESIKRTISANGKFYTTHFGFQRSLTGDAESFVREFGVRDFILCVGRIESRKNQLMLLKALEDSDTPVVLAGGGFSYQPEYEQAVRNFKRKGKTIITGRLTESQLAGAYAACKVHVLPSWYELPGMVTLEAASYGKNVVTSDWGTIKDYLGDRAFYCDPSNESSIKNAITAAWYAPVAADMSSVIASFSWSRTASECISAYKTICSKNIAESKKQTAETSEWMKRVEDRANEGNFDEAIKVLVHVEASEGASNEIIKTKGIVYLAKGDITQATVYLKQALEMDPTDARTLSALGMCDLNLKRMDSAYNYFKRSLDIEPSHLLTIHYLMQCAYSMEKYQDLVIVLEKYTTLCPDDVDMRFCLAGCYYKNGEYNKATQCVEQVLDKNNTHRGALELNEKLEEQAAINKLQNVAPTSSSSNTKPNNQDLLVEVEELKRRGKYENAYNKFMTIGDIEKVESYLQEWAYSLAGDLETLNGNSIKGNEIFNLMLTKWPQSTRAICGLGTILALNGKWSEAEAMFHQARSVNERSDVALAGLGLCAHIAKDTGRAWEWYSKALSINPENVRALLGVIELGYSCGKLKEVEKAIENYLETHPADLDFIYSLAGCYFAQNRLDDAVEQINKITLFDPAHSKAKELEQMIQAKRTETTTGKGFEFKSLN